MRKIALLLVLAVSCWSCAVPCRPHDESFSSGLKLVREKKYQDAISSYDKLAKDSAGTGRGAAALFAAAELRAWYDNPGRDYAAAVQKFDEFLKQYPEHEKSREAQNWRHIIRTVLELRKENEHLTQNIEQLKRVDIRHEERRTSK